MRGTMIVMGFLLIMLWAAPALAEEYGAPVTFEQRNLSGPRFGLVYIAGDSELWRDMEREGLGRVVSVFGWHFEQQVVPKGGGAQFVVEFVPLVAGVEYGKVAPSLTTAMGVRLPSGIEFGMGPNLFLSKDETDSVELKTSLLLALGKSFNYGGVSVPINIAMATAPEGNRFSLVFGYAMDKTKQPSIQSPDF